MVTIWDNTPKTGTTVGGWNYNEIGYSYNQLLDPQTGGIVYYNGSGQLSIWSNQTKN